MEKHRILGGTAVMGAYTGYRYCTYCRKWHDMFGNRTDDAETDAYKATGKRKYLRRCTEDLRVADYSDEDVPSKLRCRDDSIPGSEGEYPIFKRGRDPAEYTDTDEYFRDSDDPGPDDESDDEDSEDFFDDGNSEGESEYTPERATPTASVRNSRSRSPRLTTRQQRIRKFLTKRK